MSALAAMDGTRSRLLDGVANDHLRGQTDVGRGAQFENLARPLGDRCALPKVKMKLSPVQIPDIPKVLRVEALHLADARFSCDAAAGVIEVYDSIGPDAVSPAKISAALRQVGPKPVTVAINSPGGDVFAGLAIFNVLRGHAPGVRTRIDGLAASAASIVAMAGDTIEAASASQIMIHEAHGFAAGTAQDFEQVAGVLKKINATLASIYSGRTGIAQAEIARMLADETWLDAAEAAELGFVDRVLEQGAKAAPRQASNLAPTSKRELETLLRGAGLSRSASNRAAAAAFGRGDDTHADFDFEKIAAVVAANTTAIRNLR